MRPDEAENASQAEHIQSERESEGEGGLTLAIGLADRGGMQ